MTRRFCAWFLAVALPTALLAILGSPVAAAAPKTERRGEIFIANDADFDREHGIRNGKGTRRSPYVISNWDVSSITIKDTSKYLVIRNNVVSNQLVLDWNGDRVDIHHNDVGDLRVNQNVPRTGGVTDGRIHHNHFGIVGQLRHWDGVFEKNTIGSADVLAGRGAFKAMQIDGFNGSKIRNNKIFGYVDAKLHGHHHGSSFGKSSHYHGGEGYGEHMVHHDSGVDHTKRYHRVEIANNNITSDNSYALRYYDQAHTGDDRTNASETNKFLNCPHVHFTRATIKGNQLKGGGIVVDIFNAFDENHWGTKRGRMNILNNRISLDRDVEDLLFARSGITVQQAVDIDLNIIGNRVFGPKMVEEGDILELESKLLNKGAGINLLTLDKGRVQIRKNLVTSRTFGVLATQFTKSVRWWVKGLKTADVEKAVQYDSSVKNPPNQG
jgi:hypothetical protein